MRLHHLSITAFGPFVDTVAVDFDALCDAGLFLLSGATGAGKSSVLDAVCFALYGAIPGDRNHAGRLRSDQAPAGLAPQVTLDATLAGRRFRLVRSPAWDRPKKRGSGTTREPAKVTLSERTADQWRPLSSRLDETGDLVSGLLGMNLDQFCQVALLPQGQFQAFLRADSAQRHQLLARLFRTGRFERVESWLRDHRLTLRRGSDVHLTGVSDLVSRLSEAAGTVVPEEIADLSMSSADGSLWAWAASLRDEAGARAAATDAAADSAQGDERSARESLAAGRELAVARTRVVDAAAALELLSEQDEEHSAARERLVRAHRAAGLVPLALLVDDREAQALAAQARAEAALAETDRLGLDADDLAGEIDGLSRRVATLTALLPAERRLTDLRAQEQAYTEALAALHRDDELAAAEHAHLLSQVAALTTDLAASGDAVQRLPQLEVEATALRAAATALADLARLRAEHALATVDHAAATARLLDLREALLDLRERRIAGMAAELAGALAVGDDCPVCGSADHPRPAVPATGHPDAAAEREAQRLVDDAQFIQHTLDLKVNELSAAIETAALVAGDTDPEEVRMALSVADDARAAAAAQAARHPQLQEQLGAAGQRAAAVEDATSARRVRSAELSTGLDHVREQATTLEEEVAAARGDHPALSEAVDQLERRRTLARDARAAVVEREAAHGALTDAAVALGRAALEAGFDSADEARAAELPAEEHAGLETSLRDHEAAVAAARQVLTDPASVDLLATPPPDTPALEAAHRAASELLEGARAAHEVSVRRHQRLRGLADDLGAALEGWAPLRERLALATAVSAFAEGKAPDNRLQMRLSAYVLAYRLSQVVAAANTRLAGMSDQRYSLEHVGRRGAGESRGGLSLVVRDDWSGESRDPATLSGGETFVVSLALALGLADVVAHEAGGADLATLFVDEGFGSLDAETLDDVLDILDTLRENGRAVGVVSHVAEMRDRIPTQLVVSKARSGSSLRISC